ncbi:hypothetical protein K7432_018200, partial [Basidiobolus ranarum]
MMFNLKKEKEKASIPYERVNARHESGYSYFSIKKIILLPMAVLLIGVILFSLILLQEFREEIDCGEGCQVKDSPSEFRYTIVTAASSNHFCPLLGFLYSLHDTKLFLDKSEMPRIVIYDMNLGVEERSKLHGLKEKGYIHQMKKFNFEKYP